MTVYFVEVSLFQWAVSGILLVNGLPNVNTFPLSSYQPSNKKPGLAGSAGWIVSPVTNCGAT